MVEVHADVSVTTPGGTFDGVDYFLMLPEDGEWLIDYYLSDEARGDMSQDRIDEIMNQS
jgi:hypothetical protein